VAHILLAEDDDALRGLIVRALADDGHQTVATTNGVEAIDALSHHDARFDLLLTDVKMPAMDGIALAMAVARDYPAIPIMLMTGYADQRERAHGLDALVHEFLAKPFTVNQIRSAVTDALTASRH
jgi:CheY-like chemotaxis protein